MSLSISEELCYCTVRIECQNSAGQISTGTGFIFTFQKDENTIVPIVITNKHVVANMNIGRFIMTKADSSQNPIDNDHFTLTINDLQSLIRNHPEMDIDLCALPLAPLLNYAHQNSIRLFYKTFNKSQLPTTSQLDELTALEDILMIGYPNGIWDSVNNMPILRKGSTATHPCLDYNGKKEFMIDAACFPGSSGSPVLIFNQSGYTTKSGTSILGGRRVLLMGVLYAGPQHTATGELKIVNVPTRQQPVANIFFSFENKILKNLEESFNKKELNKE